MKTHDFLATPVRIRAVRVAFFALLFMNLAYFAWAHWIDAPRPVPVNEAIARLPRLKLADEVSPAERPTPHTAQKTSLSPTACLSAGPFGDPAASGQATALLKTKGLEPRQRTEPGQASQSYWVYVGSLSQSEADGALVALERNGIQDARVVPENGDAGRRLSLGIYSERARAERRAEAVRQSGLKAEIAERKLSGTLYWVDLMAAPGIDAVAVQNLLAERVNSRMTVQPCPAGVTVAPAAPIDAAVTRGPAPQPEPATDSKPMARAAESPRLP